VRGRPILENEFITIYGSRYDRETSMIALRTPFGTVPASPVGGTMQVGYTLTCSGVDEGCDWSERVNGPLTDARPAGVYHAKFGHGIGVKLWPVSTS